MRWNGQTVGGSAAAVEGAGDPNALPGFARLSGHVRSVSTPEFAGMTFHEVLAKSALNHVPGSSSQLPFAWTINPYRGCSHACVYCFARPSHNYLELDAGKDFDQQIIVKVNVADVVKKEVAKSSWNHDAVALGTNTDPYQRAEGRYSLMPGIITALAESGTPLSVLTKGTLLRRDLGLLTAAAEQVPVSIAMSIAIYDDELQQSIEPGTPTTKARLATVTAARNANLACEVFMMPILPLLTDSVDHLERAVFAAKSAGATSVLYTALRLQSGVRPWFEAWLEREHPELTKPYQTIFRGGASASAEYRKWLGARIRPILRRHGMDRGTVDPATGGIAQPRKSGAKVIAAPRVAAANASTLFAAPTLF